MRAPRPAKPRGKVPREASHLEASFDFLWLRLRPAGAPLPVAEYRFDAVRKWRFDRAFPDQRVAVELEGGIYSRGRHTRAAGFIADAEKYNAAAVAGWLVLRFVASDLRAHPDRVVGQVASVLGFGPVQVRRHA